jgi:hypothetical protein
MHVHRTVAAWPLSAFCIACLIGCAPYSFRAYAGPDRPPSDVATIVTDDISVGIGAVDGHRAGTAIQRVFWGRSPGVVYVEPGRHVVVPAFFSRVDVLCYGRLELDAHAGMTYRIRHRFYGADKAVVWFEGQPEPEPAWIKAETWRAMRS